MKKLLGILVLSATKLRPSRLYQVSKRQKSVVARDGIEPPTQAFSGLCSRDSDYFAPAKSSFLISER